MSTTTSTQVSFNELEESNLYKLDPNIDDMDLDIEKVLADINDRCTIVAYSDASLFCSWGD